MAVKAASDINMSFVLEHFDGDDQRTLYDVSRADLVFKRRPNDGALVVWESD